MISLYQKVTDQILTQLTNGTVPWIKLWSATAGRNTPCNAVTNRPYSGVNTLLLWQSDLQGFTAPRFLTFRQANVCGGRVRKGQNGFRIYFVKRARSKQEDENTDDTIKSFTIMREYTVFNIDQCEGLPKDVVSPTIRVLNHDEREQTADEFIRHSKADIRSGSGEAYYAPGHDFISLPSWEAFRDRSAFYNVAFHELTHWTGHKSRLDRDLRNRFGTRTYAAEELVAELGAAYLCAEFGFDNVIRSASYINSWIDLLRHDNRAVFTAASKANKAAEYLRQLAIREDECSIVPSIHPSSLPTQSSVTKSEWVTSTRSTAQTSDHQGQ